MGAEMPTPKTGTARPRRQRLTAGDVMAGNVETVHVDHDVREAARRMRDRGIGFLVVVDGDQVVGVLSERDIVYGALAEDRTTDEMPVSEAMSRRLPHCPDGLELGRAAALMGREGVSYMLVTDRDEQLVGVLSLENLIGRAGRPGLAAGVLRRLHSERPDPPGEVESGPRAQPERPGRIKVYAQRPHLP